MRYPILLSLLSLLLFSNCKTVEYVKDWRYFAEDVNVDRFRTANEALGPPAAGEQRVVFMGNSITEAWPKYSPEFFVDNNYIGRGVSGQTTPQMLLRFKTDVISLQPKVVVILAGINDIAQNSGYIPLEIVAENIAAMSELAQFHGIDVILCSVLPAIDFPWNPGMNPAPKALELNALIQSYASQNDLPYIDYHAAMKDSQNGLQVPKHTSADDLVHPNKAGYELMESLLQPAIKKALQKSNGGPMNLSPLFSDHMVLQQRENVAIWGQSRPNEKVIIQATWGTKANAISDSKGDWSTKISTPGAGGPYEIEILSENKNITLQDVMIGEVWLASGQSNMQMPLKGWPPNDIIDNSDAEIRNSNNPNIRMFTVQRSYGAHLKKDLVGDWQVSNPQNAGDFSASAYFFARKLQETLNVPVGIIHSSWGGTPAESWTSSEALRTLGDFDGTLNTIENPANEEMIKNWYSKWNTKAVPDSDQAWADLKFDDQAIAQLNYNDAEWISTELPNSIDKFDELELDGVFWLRKKITITDLSADYNLTIGAIDDMDNIYINGKTVGAMLGSGKYNLPRNYKVPTTLLTRGENVIAIRVIDTGGGGSITGSMSLSNSNTTIPLAGTWKKLAYAEIFNGKFYIYDPSIGSLSERPDIVQLTPRSPTVLYNQMIYPLLPYNIKGAIWYQGESNVGRHDQYARLFPAMIEDWRQQWKSQFPFYFVQIAPYRYNSGESSNDQSQKLRDAQRKTLQVPKTGMAIALDIGMADNIHPGNKQDIGDRLARLALANDYGKNIVASGPLYKSHEIDGDHIIISFEHVYNGLQAGKNGIVGFEIAGNDKRFITANATIVDDKVQVSAPSLPSPQYVRYAWRDVPALGVFNVEGLPMTSFSTE